MSDGTRVMWMRGGTSKGAYFLAEDLPIDPAARLIPVKSTAWAELTR